MPLEVACRICIGAELSGQLSPLEDYEREVTWIEHDLESANERFRTHQKALACLTQDKALLDEQVSQDTKTRAQRSEDRRAQVEALKTAKFTCRQIMQDISRAMPAAALHSDSRRLCTQSELKAQIKRLQEVAILFPCPSPFQQSFSATLADFVLITH
jgi:septal ring factor EnvC (AmiA/AmiB activator)